MSEYKFHYSFGVSIVAGYSYFSGSLASFSSEATTTSYFTSSYLISYYFYSTFGSSVICSSSICFISYYIIQKV